MIVFEGACGADGAQCRQVRFPEVDHVCEHFKKIPFRSIIEFHDDGLLHISVGANLVGILDDGEFLVQVFGTRDEGRPVRCLAV